MQQSQKKYVVWATAALKQILNRSGTYFTDDLPGRSRVCIDHKYTIVFTFNLCVSRYNKIYNTTLSYIDLAFLQTGLQFQWGYP